jgi:hypothetical protein
MCVAVVVVVAISLATVSDRGMRRRNPNKKCISFVVFVDFQQSSFFFVAG